MVLFLRAGSRMAGVAVRSLQAGSHVPKGGAGGQIPIAGVRALLSRPASPLPRKSSALVSLARSPQARAAHTLVMVLMQDDTELAPLYAERLSKVINNEMLSLDRELRSSGSVAKVEANEVVTDGDVKPISEEYPEKQSKMISFVADGKLSDFTEAEMDTLIDHKMKAAFEGHKGDRCVAAIEQMGKNIDLSLYGVKWQQQSIFERLDARIVGQSLLLEDLCDAPNRKNFIDSFFLSAGRQIFPKKLIMAKRHMVTLVPYACRYYFYAFFLYSLFAADIPFSVSDYALLVIGAQWVGSDELRDKLSGYYAYYKNGGKEEAAKDGGQKKV